MKASFKVIFFKSSSNRYFVKNFKHHTLPLSSYLGIKFLTDINEELSTRRNQLNKLKALQREADEQKKELQEIHQKVIITYHIECNFRLSRRIK